MPPSSGSGRPPLISTTATVPGKGPPPPGASTPPGAPPRKRTSHACDRCRLLRTKCSGGQKCHRCKKDDTECVYGDHKREKARKDLADSVSRINVLEEEKHELLLALRQLSLSPSFRQTAHSDLMQLMAKYADDEHPESSSGSRSQSHSLQSPPSKMDLTESSQSRDYETDRGAEGQAPSSIGSPGNQGELRRVVDLDHGTGAVGYIGKLSEMSWMQRCREYLISQQRNTPDPAPLELDQHTAAVTNLVYYTDDLDLLEIDEETVDAVFLPSVEAVVIITEAYFHATKGAYRFIMHEEFLDTLVRRCRQKSAMSWPDRRFLAQANIVLAIGSKWLQLAKLDNEEIADYHLVYYARARALGLDHRILFDHPDLEMVQGISLLAFYLLINGSISRAWNTVAHAIQHAVALGLHLKVSDPSISDLEQDKRARLWFSLYKLQMLISEIIGRPQLIRSAHITVSLDLLKRPTHNVGSVGIAINPSTRANAQKLWLDFLRSNPILRQEASRTMDEWVALLGTGSFASPLLFPHHIRLCQIGEKVADELYTGRHDMPWSETQERIERLQESLNAWTASLPDELQFDQVSNLDPDLRPQVEMAMHFYSVSMILYRPCLCEIRIAGESARSRAFNHSTARACVRAAMSMLDQMPNEARMHRLYQVLPWWAMLHYVSQATAVLLLELCLNLQHFQNEETQVVDATHKAMVYLGCMTAESTSAYKAWRTFRQFLHQLDLQHPGPLRFDIPLAAVKPPRWTENDEQALLAALI